MTTDKIIGSLVGITGHTFDIVYDLFFTTERVIGVIIQHPGDSSRQFTPIWQSVFIGSAWTARMDKMNQDRTAESKRHSLQNMTPDEMVSAHPRNFEVRYSEISAVEIKRQLFQSQLRFHLSKPSNSKEIVRFNLSRKQVREVRRLLKLVSLPDTKGK